MKKLLNTYLTPNDIEDKIRYFKYIYCLHRGGKTQVGLIVVDKQNRIGWSLYNEHLEKEVASVNKGILIALNRAASGVNVQDDLLDRIMSATEYRDFCPRLWAVKNVIGDEERRLKEEEELGIDRRSAAEGR